MYIFHLGRQPDISYQEILARYPNMNTSRKEAFAFTHDDIENASLMQQRLGGTMMISKIFTTLPIGSSSKDIIEELYKYIVSKEKKKEGKMKIGISSTTHSKKYISLGFDLKKLLQEEKISSRIITGKNHVLNTAHIIKEKLLHENGFHFWIISQEENMYLSQTITVQDIDKYSLRDYEKPFRDNSIGMLPPKLAQIMINLAHPAKKILDPFCGTGTLLIEAMEMGKEMDGFDIQKKCTEGTQRNIQWYQKYTIHHYQPFLMVQDATKMNTLDTLYDAIVTEGYLGPIYLEHPSKEEQYENFVQLEKLYTPFFRNATKILKNNGKIVITFPVYHYKEKYNSFFSHFKDSISPFYKQINTSLMYGREHQGVWREIVVLQKK